MIRRLLALFSLALLGAGAILVPMPLVEFAPGAATSVVPMLHVDAPLAALDGDLRLLTVRTGQPSVLESIRASLDPARNLVHRDRVMPRDVDRRTYLAEQRDEFRRTFDVAAAVGASLAGQDVRATTAAQVASVLAEGPSVGVLMVGDLVLEVRGMPVESGEEVADEVRGTEVGEVVPLRIERAGTVLDVEVVAGQVAGMERPGLGIAVGTAVQRMELPFDIRLAEDSRIGGPSAGLVFALAVYDLLSDEDLVRGRVVAATGSMRLDGTVGRVGGIREKVLTAARSDVDIFLVPADQLDEAHSVRSEGVQIVGAATIEEALEALRR